MAVTHPLVLLYYPLQTVIFFQSSKEKKNNDEGLSQDEGPFARIVVFLDISTPKIPKKIRQGDDDDGDGSNFRDTFPSLYSSHFSSESSRTFPLLTMVARYRA